MYVHVLTNFINFYLISVVILRGYLFWKEDVTLLQGALKNAEQPCYNVNFI